MDRQAYIDEIKFRLTGGVLECELDDVAFNRVLDASLREIQRYIDTTDFATVPFKGCIDMNIVNNGKVNSVINVYRNRGFVTTSTSDTATETTSDSYYSSSSGWVDPMYANQWQLLSGGASNMSAYNGYVMNVASYSTLLQTRNTMSTDLYFKYDKSNNKLYVNVSSGVPTNVTIEYIPRYDDVSEITSDYWIDNLIQLAVATSKIALGRIRTRYNQSGALWTQDGDTILAEGKGELDALRSRLQDNTQLIYGID